MLRISLRTEVGVADPVEVRAIGSGNGSIIPAKESGTKRRGLVERQERKVAAASRCRDRGTHGARGWAIRVANPV